MNRNRPQGPADRAVSSDRGASDLIGFVLVFGLIVSVVGLVTVVGFDTLQTTREAEQTQNAERAMEVLADNLNDVQQRGAPSRATEISLDDAQIALEPPIEIRVRNPSPALDETFEVRPLVYQADDGTKFVYVMGAIFRVQDESGVVVREWQPVLDPDRVILPILNTNAKSGSAQSIQSSTVLVRASRTGQTLHVANTTGAYDDVTLSVTSPRRDLWLKMLGTHDAFTCVPDGSDTVTCSLDDAPEKFYLTETSIDIALNL